MRKWNLGGVGGDFFIPRQTKHATSHGYLGPQKVAFWFRPLKYICRNFRQWCLKGVTNMDLFHY